MARLPVVLLVLLSGCFVSPDRLRDLRPDDSQAVVDADGDGIAAEEDCDDHDPDVGDAIMVYADVDGDGFGAGAGAPGTGCSAGGGFAATAGDCDDADGDRFPGRAEVADDGVDQDCTGADTVTCFVDGDHDGWGTATVVLAADGTCDASDGEAANDDDCADADATRFPGATETPGDGIDQNCDGADTPACYHDDDLDGFGDPLAPIVTEDCAGQSGVIVGTDCADDDSTVHPGAAELCDGQANTCGALPAAEIDADADGYVACAVDAGGWDGTAGVVGGGDCDASNGATHPGATEICDGKVNLCGGSLPANEIDSDDDGYVACTFAPGVNAGNWGNAETLAVIGGGDCDASNGATHPGATEICDGKVNLCGGSLPANEIDGDDDGYVACTFASGVTSGNWGNPETPAVIGGGDCEATNGSAWPGGTEICDDGADGDCDGTPDASDTCIPIEVRPVAPLSTATVTTRQPTLHWVLNEVAEGAIVQICADRACTDVEVEVDVAGTSFAPSSDLAAGVHFWRLWGRAGDAESLAPSPTWEFFVPHRSTPRDTSHGRVPDYNGDGYADLVVGARGYPTGPGKAYVYYGGPDGLSETADLVLDPPVGGSGEFGGPPGNAGDVDGDGYGDLIVGAPAATGGGRAFVYFGSSAGLPATPGLTLTCPATSPTRCGDGANGVGDVNGDGFADLALGAGGDTEVYVFFGRAGGPSTTPGATLTGISGTSAIYYRVWGGDLDGDDLSDILVTAPLYNSQRGRVYVFNGSATAMSSSASYTIENHLGLGTLCSSNGGRCPVGDWNGDGRLDLAVAILSGGKAHLYYGGPSGLPDDPMQTLGFPDSGSWYFASNAYDAGDVDGDGYSDLLVADTEFGADIGDKRPGGAWLYLGGASGVSSTWSVQFAGVHPDRFLGVSGGGADFDGDGFSDLVVGNQRLNTDGRLDIYRGGEESPSSTPDVQLKLDPAVNNSWFAQSIAL